MRKITIIGNVGKEWTKREINNELTTYETLIFVSNGKDKNGKEIESDAYPITAFNKRGAYLCDNYPKGKQIAVECEVKSRFGKGELSNKIFTNYQVVGFTPLYNNASNETREATPEAPQEQAEDSILWD